MRYIIIFLILTLPALVYANDIILTLEKPKKLIKISDVSQRNPNRPFGVFFNKKIGYLLAQNADEKAKNWFEKYTIPVSLIVFIQNTSKNDIKLFEEWNSWGYYNLKFCFYDGIHEYWVTKKKGLWYRNFPTRITLKTGESFHIPVALDSSIWNGINEIRKNSKKIIFLRVLYEQYISENSFDCFNHDDSWQGSVSSKYYPAEKLLSKFNFKRVEEDDSDDFDLEIK